MSLDGEDVQTLSDAELIAKVILDGFIDYRRKFHAFTVDAKRNFEQADWQAIQAASKQRIELYDEFSATVLDHLNEKFTSDRTAPPSSSIVKSAYLELIKNRPDFELAETVFNTIFRKFYRGVDVNDENAFVTTLVSFPTVDNSSITTRFAVDKDFSSLFKRVLLGYHFSVPFENLDRDIERVVSAFQANQDLSAVEHIEVEVLNTVFYRNKGAYIIGRIFLDAVTLPLAIPILNEVERGLYIDTVIWNENDLSLIFSFTRSYFMVDIEHPSLLINFLQSLLPAKKLSELYSSIGFYKHGKTEFYRGFLASLASTDDQFVIAEGIKGLVMTVFTLPSYQVVFKVIKDKFSPTKKVTRQQVRDSYYFVRTHDRVGRMADTQEFSNFVLPRNRISDELMEELLSVAAASVTIKGDKVILKHLYTERLMIPLNIYIDNAYDEAVYEALEEYGNAIKQLAAANIFPGDMLLKNFGVTRHGRVVFYDYDEISTLLEVNFRKIPPPRYPEDEMASEPWYSVGPMDVFPEEFETFLFHTPRLKKMFAELHGDLYKAEYWQDLQRQIHDNQVVDVFPYRRKKRFERNSWFGSIE